MRYWFFKRENAVLQTTASKLIALALGEFCVLLAVLFTISLNLVPVYLVYEVVWL